MYFITFSPQRIVLKNVLDLNNIYILHHISISL